MAFPTPTEKQGRVLWFSLTALAVAVLLALLGLLLWGLGFVINKLTPVLLPLAIAGILAYLLDPAVDFFERALRIPRVRAIILVFFLALMLVLMLLAFVVPKIVVDAGDLLDKLPGYAKDFREKFSEWLAQSKLGSQAKHVWDLQAGENVQKWLTNAVPVASAWLIENLSRVASWAGYVIGLALVPVYVFYFLFEKAGIAKSWTEYLPVRESKLKKELVFVLQSVNDCIVVFFRGQILVSMCTGMLLAIGWSFAGLNYAVVLGGMAAVLCIMPYIGATITLVTALVLAAVQFTHWTQFAGVLSVYVVVQLLEGFVYSPKIIGDRVGLHPVSIIIALMVGTTLLGGVLGGLLAIPLTAALRTLMFRYVWRRQDSAAGDA
ncbi:MAG: AI-2E family transporter [Verrucomicrobia bacterium]|nr:AI-2E family transporter [Verrucomicrobiota bacterium]